VIVHKGTSKNCPTLALPVMFDGEEPAQGNSNARQDGFLDSFRSVRRSLEREEGPSGSKIEQVVPWEEFRPVLRRPAQA